MQDINNSLTVQDSKLVKQLKWFVMHFKKEWQIYLLLAPTVIWFLVFLYKPMYGLQIAFKDYSVFKGITESPWIGLEHFYTLFASMMDPDGS